MSQGTSVRRVPVAPDLAHARELRAPGLTAQDHPRAAQAFRSGLMTDAASPVRDAQFSSANDVFSPAVTSKSTDSALPEPTRNAQLNPVIAGDRAAPGALGRLWRQMVQLWGGAVLIPFIPALYALLPAWRGDLRPEHIGLALLVPVVGFWGPRAKRFLIDVSPYILVAIGYDLVRYVRPVFVTEGRVIGVSLREAELMLFGVGPNTTLQDFFQIHNSPVFDLIFAVPYMIFVYVAALYAIYLYFVDRPRMRHYLLAFAISNYLAFACWLLFPAAPPWYLRQYGPNIDITALPSPAGLARVDALLGIEYFKNFYSRASSVFGALPSMHCAYPMLGLLTAYRVGNWRSRSLHLLYAITMVVAAVYLDHHWVIDCVAGLAMAVVSVQGAGYWLKRREAARSAAQAELTVQPALEANKS